MIKFQKNPIKLVGKTFKANKNIGTDIEQLLGSSINSRKGADFGFWELKTRKTFTRSAITLGGKKDDNIMEVKKQVYNKIQNVLFYRYIVNDDKTFTITRLTILWGLDYKLFMNSNRLHFETRNRQTTIKIALGKFIKLYGKNIIIYE